MIMGKYVTNLIFILVFIFIIYVISRQIYSNGMFVEGDEMAESFKGVVKSDFSRGGVGFRLVLIGHDRSFYLIESNSTGNELYKYVKEAKDKEITVEIVGELKNKTLNIADDVDVGKKAESTTRVIIPHKYQILSEVKKQPATNQQQRDFGGF